MIKNLFKSTGVTKLAGSQACFNTSLRRSAFISPMISAHFRRFNSNNYKLNTDSRVVNYTTEGPRFVKFTEEHEWLAAHSDDTVFIGITRYASEALGDATYVELPELGAKVEVGESIGSVESVKSASEIYSPAAGEIFAVNGFLESNPQAINDDPMGEAWIAQIKLNESFETLQDQEGLMSESEYEKFLQED